MLSEYISKTGERAVTNRNGDSALPTNIAPWSRIGKASGVTIAETLIITREGYVIQEQGNA